MGWIPAHPKEASPHISGANLFKETQKEWGLMEEADLPGGAAGEVYAIMSHQNAQVYEKEMNSYRKLIIVGCFPFSSN